MRASMTRLAIDNEHARCRARFTRVAMPVARGTVATFQNWRTGCGEHECSYVGGARINEQEPFDEPYETNTPSEQITG